MYLIQYSPDMIEVSIFRFMVFILKGNPTKHHIVSNYLCHQGGFIYLYVMNQGQKTQRPLSAPYDAASNNIPE